MARSRRWPVAVAALVLGLFTTSLVVSRLVGQPAAPPPAPLPRELASFSPVVKRILPAVVSIEGKAPGAAKTGKAAKAASEGEIDPGFGSGVLIDPSGVVLTNNHVVRDAESVVVILNDGRQIASKDIRRDPKSDLAIIVLKAGGPLPFLEYADSSQLEVGDRVLAAGAPFGLAGSISHGIISGKGRANLHLNLYEDWLQTDAAVNPGSSGGPLVTLDGKLVGITAAIKTKSGGFSGVGLAVASNLCKKVSSQLLKDGIVHRGYLGANVRGLDEAEASKHGLKLDSGVIITKIYEKGPAGKAGLAADDIITSIAGLPVKAPRDVQRIVSDLIGRTVEVRIIRGNQAMVAKVMIEEQPAAYGRAARGNAAPPQPANPGKILPFESFGIALIDLAPELATRLGFPKETKGAAVITVVRGGIAEQAGLKSGHVIVQVDKTPITTAAGFEMALGRADPEKGAVIHVLRPSGEVEYAVLKLK